MARRKTKRRTHLGAKNGPQGADASGVNGAARIPKSMVIRIGAGDVGPSVSQLVKDFRQMMEPHTASRLRERKSNRLRDYTTMAGPLGVSHLVLFSRSENGNVNLRLALTPRGPTMHFRVDSYSLCKDVKRAMRRPPGTTNEFTAPPLLVMNNFMTQNDKEVPNVLSKNLESLSVSVFQSLFPAISPATTPLSSIQRVLLLNRETPKSTDTSSYVLNLRHYAISTKRTGLPKAIRRLNAAEKVLSDSSKRRKGLPNLGKLSDMADYLLDPGAAGGFTSGSESEAETDAEVEMLQNQTRKVISRKKGEDVKVKEEKGPQVEKRAIKLSELGPRLKLRLMKIEEGVCTGKVMWHEFIKKTKGEERAQDKAWEEKKRVKEERKKLQRENVERKRKEKGAKGGNGDGDGDGDGEDDGDDYGDDWDSEDFEYGDEGAEDDAMDADDPDRADAEGKEGEEEWESEEEEEDEMEED